MSVRSEFSCGFESVLKRVPARVIWEAEYAGAALKCAKSLAFSGPPPFNVGPKFLDEKHTVGRAAIQVALPPVKGESTITAASTWRLELLELWDVYKGPSLK